VSNVSAILSLLHEGPDVNSSTRRFRVQPVLEWTLRRLSMSRQLSSAAVLCWEDQLPHVAAIAEEVGAFVLAKGPRSRISQIESISASRRWADGWRGGLLGTCAFDIGFYAPWVLELAQRVETEAVLLVDASAALVDPMLVDALIRHGDAHLEQEICFSAAAPGLCGALLRIPLLERLATTKIHAGRLLHYIPDHVSREMIGTDACLNVAPAVTRTVERFVLDSDRQIARTEHATACLNGQLQIAGAEEIVARITASNWNDPLPREVVIELNTRRTSNPIFSPTRAHAIARPDLTLDLAQKILSQLAHSDDIRVTFAGVGDPLLHGNLFDIIDAARSAGIHAIHVETDLLSENASIVSRLASGPTDIVSVHFPALTEATYFELMGVEGYRRVLENVRAFVANRQERGEGVPILVPIFTKCRQNLAEMEAWYDQWLKALNCAVIRGPSTFGGLVPDVGVADMTPPGRKACNRLASRITILSDGRIVSCEEDLVAAQMLGHAGSDSISDIWTTRMASLRTDHRQHQWAAHPLCATCNEWHRP
jgi:hypothetical protein